MRIALGLIMVLAPVLAAAQCEEAFDLMEVTVDTVLCNKAYDVPSGITIKTDGVTLDCNGAIIRGTGMQNGQGIFIYHAREVTVKNCNILNYDVGVYIKEGHRNRIYHNAWLKNKIGIRLLQAFENRIEENADKSILKPVSSLASKFNILQLTNKDLDRDFCAVNQCNDETPMNPCEDNDGYCSPSCTYDTDTDCPQPPEDLPPVTAYPALPDEPQPVPVQTPQTESPQTQSLATGKTTTSLMHTLPDKARIWVMTLLFVSTYLIGFLAFQHHHEKHK